MAEHKDNLVSGHPNSTFAIEQSWYVYLIEKIVTEHKAYLVPGHPQLNWCDRAVMVGLFNREDYG